MTFKTAQTKLKAIAAGRYHSILFARNEYPDGLIETSCDLYIDGMTYYSGPTWHDAFLLLNRAINGTPLEELPDVDDQP